MARIIFLGTSAALPTGRRTNTQLAVLPDGDESGILVDCGGDCFGALDRAAIGPDVISDLFITHAHIDHIGSLPSLIESLRLDGRTRPLRIWALPEVIAVARQLLALFSFELKLDEWPFTLSFHDVQGGQCVTLAGIPVQVEVMTHTVPSAGVRFELPGGDVAYTSDTQPDEGVPRLARGARALITECSMLEAEGDLARLTRHTTASEAGRQAAACGVRELYLVHVGKAWPPEAAVVEAARTFSGAIIVPDDGQAITI